MGPFYMLTKKQCDHISDSTIVLSGANWVDMNCHRAKGSRKKRDFFQVTWANADVSPKIKCLFEDLRDVETGEVYRSMSPVAKCSVHFVADIAKETIFQGPNVLPVGEVDSDSPQYSGMALLAVVVCGNQSGNDSSDFLSHDTYSAIKKTKANIFSSTQGVAHYGSAGYVAGFGSRGTTAVDSTGSSIAEYVCKPEISDKNKVLIDLIEEAGTASLSQSQSIIDKSLGSRSLVKATCLPIVAISSSLHGHVPLLGRTPYASMFLSGNASTSIAHNENDVSYTMITVPKQATASKTILERLAWEFCPSAIPFRFPLTTGSCLLYSGYFMRHRQLHKGDITTEPPIFNWGAYGNRKLDDNSRCTLLRFKSN